MKSKIIGAEHLMSVRFYSPAPDTFYDSYTHIFNTNYEYNRKQNAFLCYKWKDACFLDYMKNSKWLFRVRLYS